MHSIRTGSVPRARASPGRRRRAAAAGEVGGVGRHQVVGEQVGGLLEPERRERGEHPALVGDQVGEHDVEHRDAVGRDHEHAVVADVVEVADLARVVVRERELAQSAPVRASGARAARRGRRRCGRRCASARSRSKQAASRSSPSVVDDLRVLAQHVEERPALLPRASSRCAAPCGTRRHGVMPDSTSASSTGWLNTSPYDASRFSIMRSGYTCMPSTIERNFTST